MNNFHIYNFNSEVVEKDRKRTISSTVIFCGGLRIDESTLVDEIRKHYEKHYQSDKIFIIGGEYIKDNLIELFITNQDKTFIGIPKRQETFLKENLYLLTFNKLGELKSYDKKLPEYFLLNYLNEGLQDIFLKRGGLITSYGSHHFVFPSGKHCDRFLRTGNILLFSSEIYFIAFSILRHFDENSHTHIFCDTSSINSLAFALSELKNRFLECDKRTQVTIESFKSYEGLYNNSFNYTPNALLLISASTSSNILTYILENHKTVTRKNIIILYFLGEKKNYKANQDNIICDLTKSETNKKGIPFYQTFEEKNCVYCKNGSYPVEVIGDVFLLEKPKIQRVFLNANDADRRLSDFIKQFKSENKSDTVLKVNYKEDSEYKYEVYINYVQLLEGLNLKKKYRDYNLKLDDYINQYIPSNTKYIVSLNDQGSTILSEYIYKKIKPNYKKSKCPLLLQQDKLSTIEDKNGTIVVVGSCISNGKNLLYISRALRKFDRYRIIYFIGISRTSNKQKLEFLRGNLKYGTYGMESNSFIEVESIYCNNDSKNTSWMSEIKFIREFIDFLKDSIPNSVKAQQFLEQRKNILAESSGTIKKGLSSNLFYPRVTTVPNTELELRKNFAFFNFSDYDTHVSQSDVYFTVSNILNSLRNSERPNNLNQSIYVRKIIDPGNFNRFNDGIIQASVLRACKSEELAYNIDNELSEEMYNILETMVKYYKEDQGEALLEFLYAIAIKKLCLKNNHLKNLIELVNRNCKEKIIICFAKFIQAKVIKK